MTVDWRSVMWMYPLASGVASRCRVAMVVDMLTDLCESRRWHIRLLLVAAWCEAVGTTDDNGYPVDYGMTIFPQRSTSCRRQATTT